MKTTLMIIAIMILTIVSYKVFTGYISPAEESLYDDNGNKYLLAGADTVTNTRDTLSRKLSTPASTLKDFFKNANQVVYITADSAIEISSDPIFAAYNTDRVAAGVIYSTPKHDSKFFTNYYIRKYSTYAGVTTYKFRIEGY